MGGASGFSWTVRIFGREEIFKFVSGDAWWGWSRAAAEDEGLKMRDENDTQIAIYTVAGKRHEGELGLKIFTQKDIF